MKQSIIIKKLLKNLNNNNNNNESFGIKKDPTTSAIKISVH